MEEDSPAEPDPEALDITYEYRNPYKEAINPSRRNLEPGILEEYLVSCDTAPSISGEGNEDRYDNED
jgi:hypothetical protein